MTVSHNVTSRGPTNKQRVYFISIRRGVVIVEGTLVQQSVPRLRGPDSRKCNFFCLAEHGHVVIAPPGWLLGPISAIQMSCEMAVCELQAITINGR